MILYQLLRELLRMGNKSTETPDTPATGVRAAQLIINLLAQQPKDNTETRHYGRSDQLTSKVTQGEIELLK